MWRSEFQSWQLKYRGRKTVTFGIESEHSAFVSEFTVNLPTRFIGRHQFSNGSVDLQQISRKFFRIDNDFRLHLNPEKTDLTNNVHFRFFKKIDGNIMNITINQNGSLNELLKDDVYLELPTFIIDSSGFRPLDLTEDAETVVYKITN